MRKQRNWSLVGSLAVLLVLSANGLQAQDDSWDERYPDGGTTDPSEGSASPSEESSGEGREPSRFHYEYAPPERPAQPRPTAAGLPRILEDHRDVGIGVMNLTPPRRIEINGVEGGVEVYGATDRELEIIADTLRLLPPSHVATIPRIVVADRAGIHGGVRSGGATVGAGEICNAETGARGREWAEAYSGAGWRNPPRLEITHSSLARRGRGGVSGTILHETGHHVARACSRVRPGGSRVGVSQGLTNEQHFPDICYAGRNATRDQRCGELDGSSQLSDLSDRERRSRRAEIRRNRQRLVGSSDADGQYYRAHCCGGEWERFADAYLAYFQGRRSSRGAQTIQEYVMDPALDVRCAPADRSEVSCR